MRTRITLLFAVVLLLATMNAWSDIPRTISYQGKLTNLAGNPVSDASYQVTVTLYHYQASTTAIWGPHTYTVTTKGGLFNLNIGGDVEPLPTSVFNGNTWIEIKVGDEVMSPRQRLLSVGYAFHALEAESLTLPYQALTATSVPAINIVNSGSADAARFEMIESSSNGSAVYANSNAKGPAVYGFNSGTGSAAKFEINNPESIASTIVCTTNGYSPAAEITSTSSASNSAALYVGSTGSAAVCDFRLVNSASKQNAVSIMSYGSGSGGAAALYSTNYGLGSGGGFYVSNINNVSPALTAWIENGMGPALMVNHRGWLGNLAVFQRFNTNVARIDLAGKGYFNGGTQNTGADVAESFEVEGERSGYEPGDVLVISTTSDRKVEKSTEPYSTLVAGVYATKPGVLLTDRDIESNLDDTVPMGVNGVIPTKVCAENGPIHRGDLLVTSSTPGHAMKASKDRLEFGMALGKALQNFEGPGTGVIKVLVNVK